ncbi:MAG: hypothetical protein IBX45_02185 [Campylobacterales bacterium]|nr:hypothetical protein [Campylobacterales bacterium]
MNNWLKTFKLAIITNDLSKCEMLINSFHATTFTCKEELEEAAALTKEAITLLETQRVKLGSELAKLKQTKKYLTSHAS